MRIAISGSHVVGKTTLAEALAEALPGHELVPEPYHLLEEDGYEFAELPTIEDFELQLQRSLECLQESGRNVIFDRCPLDMIGYLVTHRDAGLFQLETWMPRVRDALATLDLIVYVPVEEPDSMPVPRSQARLRARVDTVLAEIVADDRYGLERPAITVGGSLGARLRQVVAHVRALTE